MADEADAETHRAAGDALSWLADIDHEATEPVDDATVHDAVVRICCGDAVYPDMVVVCRLMRQKALATVSYV
jgi:hypothetical protein